MVARSVMRNQGFGLPQVHDVHVVVANMFFKR